MNARMVWRLCMVCVIAGIVGLLLVLKAAAHGWYENRCCHDRDCFHLPPGAVRITSQGYVVMIPGGAVHALEYTDPRIRMIPSEAPADEQQMFHACTVAGDPRGMLLCLYVPTGGA